MYKLNTKMLINVGPFWPPNIKSLATALPPPFSSPLNWECRKIPGFETATCWRRVKNEVRTDSGRDSGQFKDFASAHCVSKPAQCGLCCTTPAQIKLTLSSDYNECFRLCVAPPIGASTTASTIAPLP